MSVHFDHLILVIVSRRAS